MITKIQFILLLVLPLFFLSSCGAAPSEDNLSLDTTPVSPAANSSSTSSPKPTADLDDYVSLNTKNGQIVIRLFSQLTPKTVANFVDKVNTGFYNGLSFHRVIEGFMAQGGDFKGDGTGGGTQPSELNDTAFVRGSVGLARTAQTSAVSNDSQFFICFTDNGCSHLTGEYVNFGQVVSGLDILDQIRQGDKIISMSAYTK